MLAAPEFRTTEGHALRLLLLEDDPAFAQMVQLNLNRVHWASLTLEHVQKLGEALERLASESFDLVISDLNVPDSSGLATFDALSGATDRLILLLSGEADEAQRRDALGRGAYDLLNKDKLEAAELERVVRLA